MTSKTTLPDGTHTVEVTYISDLIAGVRTVTEENQILVIPSSPLSEDVEPGSHVTITVEETKITSATSVTQSNPVTP